MGLLRPGRRRFDRGLNGGGDAPSQVKRKLDDKIYALKRLNIQDIPPKDLDDSLNEIRILVSFKHPRIIRCYETFFSESTPAGHYRHCLWSSC